MPIHVGAKLAIDRCPLLNEPCLAERLLVCGKSRIASDGGKHAGSINLFTYQ